MSRGRLTRYNQLIRGIAPHYSNVVVQPRGFPIFSDPLLKGRVRFAQKTGADFGIINPDNEIHISETAPKNTQTLALAYPNRWLEIEAVLSLGPDEEFAQVKDFGDEFITLESPITRALTSANTVNLLATPIRLAIDAALGSTTLIVQSRYHILAGDRITVATTPGLLTSLLDYKITRARLLGTSSANSPFVFQYEIDLANSTVVDLTTSSTNLFLKAQPSYMSKQVFVPQVPENPDDIGPFLLDYVSGVLFDRPVVDEQLSVTLFDKLGNLVVHDNLAPLAINKQYQVTDMPVVADVLCLWQIADGSITFSRRSSTQEVNSVALCDELGQFQLTQELIPAMPVGSEWNIPVTATNDCTLKVRFYPNDWREFDLMAGDTTQILIGTTISDNPTERIEIVAIGDSTTQVEFGNWVPAKSQVFSMIYGITADIYGDAQWQATNLFVKPVFLNFAMGLHTHVDSDRHVTVADGAVIFL